MAALHPSQPISELFSIAEANYEKKEAASKSDKLLEHMMSKGTHQDKITALSKQLQTGTPLKALQTLVSLSDYNKHRKEAILAINTLTEYFQNSLGSVKKYHHFSESVAKSKASKKKPISSDSLVSYYLEHKVKNLYQVFLKNVQNLLTNDIWFIKKTGITTLCQLVRFGQLRSTLLSFLINKFGDKDLRSINFLTKQLRDFSMHEFECIEDILRQIQATMFRKNISEECQFYCLNFLNNLNIKIMHESQLTTLFKLYFKIFTRITLSEKETQLSSKLFLNTVKGLNKLFPVIKEEFTEFTQVFEEKADFIYKTIHVTTNTKVKVQLLLFLYQTLGYLNKELPDRYYNSLYSFLNDGTLLTTSLLELFFDLLLISIKQDQNIHRVHAFMKRLLQLCFQAQPPFIITSLILISKLQEKVQPLLNKRQGYLLQEDDQYEHYDMFKRDPQHAKASNSCLWQLIPFRYHFHPTVRKFVENIINGSPIEYASNPLLDFSLTNFVQKVCLKSEKKSQGWKIKNHKLINKMRPSKYDTLINKPLEQLGLDEEFLRRYLQKKGQVRKNRKQIRDIEEYADDVVEKQIDRLQEKEVDEDEDMDYGSYEDEDDYQDDVEDYDDVGNFEQEDMEVEQSLDQQEPDLFADQDEGDEEMQEQESEKEKDFNQMFDQIDKDDDYYQSKKKPRVSPTKGAKNRSGKSSKKPPKTKKIHKVAKKPLRR